MGPGWLFEFRWGQRLMNRPRLLLADDHRLVLDALRKILEPQFDVVGIVEDGRALLAGAPVLQPDVILLDISIPLLNGIDAARQLHKTCPGVKLVFVTMHAETAYVTEAFRAGGAGYVLKQSAPKELITAIWTVVRGEYYLAPELGMNLQQLLTKAGRSRGSPTAGLTPRQREVLQLVAEGRSNKEIAGILNISVKAVEFHKSAIARKVGSSRIADLTKYAAMLGLIDS
jgi:DNA-binding NarL/FixJ family response regulator